MTVEKKAFIKDPRENMTTREKNMQLSAKLAVGPNADRKIERIERIESGGSGWQIYYRTGSA
jgi:hypothetical protein